MARWTVRVCWTRGHTALGIALVLLAGCAVAISASGRPSGIPNASAVPDRARAAESLVRVIAPPLPPNVFAAANGQLSPVVAGHRNLIYVPNPTGHAVRLIDPASFRVIGTIPTGPQKPTLVYPAPDLRSLQVAGETGTGSQGILPLDPVTATPAPAFRVSDATSVHYPPGQPDALVVAAGDRSVDFYQQETWQRTGTIHIAGCSGAGTVEFPADGRFALISCSQIGRVLVIDIAKRKQVKMIDMPNGRRSQPQDIQLSPDGKTFYVADSAAGGVHCVDAATLRPRKFVPTGQGAFGLTLARDGHTMIVTNRSEGSVSEWNLATDVVEKTWYLPGKATPEWGSISADGRMLWASGGDRGEVYAIDMANHQLAARIPVGGPAAGVLVWPQPGRYSTGASLPLR